MCSHRHLAVRHNGSLRTAFFHSHPTGSRRAASARWSCTAFRGPVPRMAGSRRDDSIFTALGVFLAGVRSTRAVHHAGDSKVGRLDRKFGQRLRLHCRILLISDRCVHRPRASLRASTGTEARSRRLLQATARVSSRFIDSSCRPLRTHRHGMHRLGSAHGHPWGRETSRDVRSVPRRDGSVPCGAMAALPLRALPFPERCWHPSEKLPTWSSTHAYR
jgi:hypothetical protein